jgi:NADPH:quinone reductase-like Zn-dependent oxidoreductase
MKAAVVHAADQAPRYETFPIPDSAEGVAVDVLAAALSPRSRAGASGQHYTSRGLLPLVPGIDGVGRLASGERVYFLAADDRLGTMAEKTLADPRLLAPLPDGVDASVIAAAMIPAISSWVALTKRARLERGQSVLVLGATGASGQLAVQIARRLGAGRVVAAGRDPEGLNRARSLGADVVVRLTGTAADGDALAAAAHVLRRARYPRRVRREGARGARPRGPALRGGGVLGGERDLRRAHRVHDRRRSVTIATVRQTCANVSYRWRDVRGSRTIALRLV